MGQFPGGDALFLVEQPEEDVLGADERMPEEACLVLGVVEGRSGWVGKTLEDAPSISRAATELRRW